jgi:hypothetical protein
MRPLERVTTTRPEVGVIVRAPQAAIGGITRTLAAENLHVSFAVDAVPSPATLALVRAAGDEALPQLRPGGPTRWLATKRQLHSIATRLGMRRPFEYVPTKPTIGQYVLARSAGGKPVTGALRIDGVDDVLPVRRGQIVELDATGPGGEFTTATRALARQLQRAKLSAVPVDSLLDAT